MLNKEVAQVPMAPASAILLSISKLVPMASWRVLCDQLVMEEKIQAWFTLIQAQPESGQVH